MQAYFDAFSGISGDMTVGALLDLGVLFDGLRTAIDGLGLPDLSIGWSAARWAVSRPRSSWSRPRKPPPRRTFAAICAILDQAPLAAGVRARALATFRVLAEAEGRIHGVAAEDVHFHEVGSADAIADVVGAAFGIEALGITRVHVSALPLGRGVVASRHGALPIPAPATVELLQGFAVRHGDGEGEMVTPTGAAILRGLGAVSAPPPPARLVGVGYGAGTGQLADRPNVLRILLGEPRRGRSRPTRSSSSSATSTT